MPESSLESQVIAPVEISAARRMYWLLRRELWENRSVYIAPLAVAATLLLVFLISQIALPHHRVRNVLALDPARQREAIEEPYIIAAGLIMGTAFIVGIFYTLDALYGERRDRSILFWKSLPVSDLTTVLSKLIVPMAILPVFSFFLTLMTQFIMLQLSTAILLGSGHVGTLWTQVSFLHDSLLVFYHIVTVHGLWYAPIYGWLLMVSAWAQRAPFVWAFLPPALICAAEKVAFNTTHFLGMLQRRLQGPGSPGSMSQGGAMASLVPHHFFSEPGLWTGLAFAAVFLAAAVRLRRSWGPV